MLAKSAEMCDILGMPKSGNRDLANRWFQPLTHVSGGGFSRKSKRKGQRGKREKRDLQRFAVAHGAAQSVREMF